MQDKKYISAIFLVTISGLQIAVSAANGLLARRQVDQMVCENLSNTIPSSSRLYTAVTLLWLMAAI